MGREIELKYRVPDDVHEDEIFSSEILSIERPQNFSMHTRYFETGDRAISNQMCSLRVRLENSVYIATFKEASERDSALAQRGEWSVACASPEPDNNTCTALVRQGAPPWISQLDGFFCECEVKFIRRQAEVFEGDFRAALSIDRGVLINGTRQEAFCELELELLSGTRQQLLKTGEALRDRFGLVPESASKHVRAKRLGGTL